MKHEIRDKKQEKKTVDSDRDREVQSEESKTRDRDQGQKTGNRKQRLRTEPKTRYYRPKTS